MSKLEYTSKQDKLNTIAHVAIASSVAFGAGVGIVGGYTTLSILIIAALFIIAICMQVEVSKMISTELSIIASIEKSNTEFIELEQERISYEMKLEEKRSKIAEKESKTTQRKLEIEKTQLAKESKQLKKEQLKETIEMKKIEAQNQRLNRQLKKVNSLENLFSASAIALLTPSMKLAKKDNRQITGQELIQIILGGMK